MNEQNVGKVETVFFHKRRVSDETMVLWRFELKRAPIYEVIISEGYPAMSRGAMENLTDDEILEAIRIGSIEITS